MLRRVIHRLQPALYKGIRWYYRKPRLLTKRGIKIYLNPTVFHPGLYHSTDIFLDYILTLNLQEKTVLELGAGNGFISLFLAKNNACKVTASDININAVEGLKQSAALNKVQFNVVHSDLFANIKRDAFDYILVNPPYYPKSVTSTDEHAFFCGHDFEYFTAFNQQIKPFLQAGSTVLMVFSETVHLRKIQELALKEKLVMEEVHRRNKMNEWFYIYQLQLEANS